MFVNQIITTQNGKITLTKGIEGISIGEVKIQAVKRFKCPLQVVEYSDYEYSETMFEADPGKYIIETE